MPLFYLVPQGHCVVIERLGRYNRVQRAGLRVRLPFIESIRWFDDWGAVANKRGWLLELTEQRNDTPPRQCHTKDNVAVTINASVYWKITEPHKARYDVDVLPQSLVDVALNSLRANVGRLDLDELLSNRQALNEKIALDLTETARKWGVIFTRVEVQEISTTDEVSSAMRQQMEAERQRRAAVSIAEGQAVAEIKRAEGEKRAAILRAEGHARAFALMTEAELAYVQQLSTVMPAESAVQLLLAQKCVEGFEAISKNPADKVFIPNSLQGLLAGALPAQLASHQSGAPVSSTNSMPSR